MKKHICSICGKTKTTVNKKHIYLLVECKECNHSYLFTSLNNHDKFVKSLLSKKTKQIKEFAENVLEFSFCPYWTLAINLKNTNKIRVCVSSLTFEESLQTQYFSEKSLKIFLQDIPHSVEIKDGFAFVTIHNSSSSSL